jgi:hypothetical protein
VSRQNTLVEVTVNGTLAGAKTYFVSLRLTIRELWGQDTSPDDAAVVREELSPMSGVVVDDGEYVLNYAYGGRDYALNRRVVSGRLLARD